MYTKPKYGLCFFLLCFAICQFANGQTERYNLDFEDISMEAALDEITDLTGYQFIYVNEIIKDRRVNISVSNVDIQGILMALFENELIDYQITGTEVTIYYTRSLTAAFQVFGHVSDAADGENLTGANVYTDASQGVTTDKYGLYSIKLDPTRDSLLFVSYLGYKTQVIPIRNTKQGRKDITLSDDLNTLITVTIVQEKQLPAIPINDLLIGKTYSSSKTISGDQDVLEYINAIPGIVKMSEGRSGFSVHGSGTDQNLIIIDEAPIFNPGHALGFLSVFNDDALNSAVLHKNAISSRFGGRLASVLDVRMREGNAKNVAVTASTNPFYSGLTVEGPVIKDRMSFLVSGRRSHFNYILNQFEPKKQFYIPRRINFYDVHGKINFKFGENNRFYVSTFLNNDEIIPYKSGREEFFYDTNWQNRTLTVRWNSIWSEKLFTNFSFVFSDYEYVKSATADTLRYLYEEKSSIANSHIKLEGNYYISKHQKLLAGINATEYQFDPATGSISVPDADFTLRYRINPIKSRELAVFIEDNIKIGRVANINLGLRYSKFYDIGNDTYEYIYDGNRIVDSTFRDKNEVIRSFNNLEPRVSLDLQLQKDWLLQSSWSRTSQYIVRLLNENPTSPNEYWIPAGLRIKPQVSDIFASALRWDANNYINLRLGYFNRKSSNVVAFRNGANIFFSESLIDRQIIQGDFKSSGVEFSIEKSKSPFHYFFSYTYTDATMQFDEINEGKRFTAPQQYQHDVNLQASLDLSKTVDIGMNWQWRSGDRISLPTGIGYVGGFPFEIYRERNNYQLPNYSRLDIISTWSLVKKSKLNVDLNIGVYNLLGRLNPFQVDVSRDLTLPRIEILALSRTTPFLHLKLRY